MLREFLRVLQPGGTLRIVVPDCEKFVNAYITHDKEWFRTGLGSPADGAEGLNRIFTLHTHRVIDDWTSLSATLREAGFSQVELSSFNGSTIPELQIDRDAPSRVAQSLYVEAQRLSASLYASRASAYGAVGVTVFGYFFAKAASLPFVIAVHRAVLSAGWRTTEPCTVFVGAET